MGGGLSKDLSAAITDHLPSLGSYHCAMIGLDSSGKTTVLYRLKFKQYVNTAPTIGFNCEKVRLNGTNFAVWDVGGQDKLRPLWRSYTRCTDGIIFVVDSCKEDRLEEAKLELLKICKGSTTTQRNSGIPLLILANKQDLPEALDPFKLEALLGLKELGSGVPWHLQATCAITGEGIDEGMRTLQEMIVRKRKKSAKPGAPLSKGVKSASSSKLSSKKLQRSNSHLY